MSAPLVADLMQDDCLAHERVDYKGSRNEHDKAAVGDEGSALGSSSPTSTTILKRCKIIWHTREYRSELRHAERVVPCFRAAKLGWMGDYYSRQTNHVSTKLC